MCSPWRSTHKLCLLLSRCHCSILWLFPPLGLPWGDYLVKTDCLNVSCVSIEKRHKHNCLMMHRDNQL